MNELLRLLKETQKIWGKGTVAAIVNKLNQKKIKWKGTLAKSIKYKQDKKTGEITFEMADYGDFVDKGVDGTRMPRGSKYKFKGKIGGTAYYLKKWASSKSLNPWAVATSIQRKGIKPRPFFDSVIEKRAPLLGKAIQNTEKEYLDSVIKEANKKKHIK